MRAGTWICLILGVLCWGCGAGVAQPPRPPGTIRIATYNIQWFSEDADPDRVSNLQSVIAHIQPDVIAMQEIQSQTALRQLFDSSWEVGIADDPQEHQELAVAVKKPFTLVSANLVFESPNFDLAFPGKRDALRCVVQTPSYKQVVVYIVHMKSRRGGRLTTDIQRQTACGLLAGFLSGQTEEPNKVVVGDFNDAPNDRSLNILESGDLNAKAGGQRDYRLLANLCDPLCEQDVTTEGVYRLFHGAALSPVVPGAKVENDRLRGMDYDYPRDVRVEQALFDQILVSPKLAQTARPVVYCGTDALTGSPGTTNLDGESVAYIKKGNLASDHLPLYVDLSPK